jgi:serine/threonine protein kinase
MTLTPKRWQKARDVLHEAMEMDEGDRSAFLDSQCASDPSLRVELNELLAAEDELGFSFLEKPAIAHGASATDSTVLAAGTKLGPYVVQSLIGAGGMGEVYRARDTRLDRNVALKILPASSASDTLRRQRLQREARVISALQHPHICTLYDVGQQDGIDFLVMELLEGETLASRLTRGRLTLDEVLTYGIEIADALDAAQRRGIIHRDLKPGNIFLTSHGECKVLDFGLAKLDDDSPDAATVAQPDVLTSPGVAIGTVAYMSPEQARGEPLDARTDIFSLGAVLYEMTTGKSPFMGRTSAVTFKAILDSTPPPPSQVNKAIPPKLDEVIGKSLEKDRELRYQSAAELRADLKRIKRDSDSQRVAATVQSEPKPERARRVTNVTWLSLILGLLAVGSLVLYKRVRSKHSAPLKLENMAMMRLTDSSGGNFSSTFSDASGSEQ